MQEDERAGQDQIYEPCWSPCGSWHTPTQLINVMDIVWKTQQTHIGCRCPWRCTLHQDWSYGKGWQTAGCFPVCPGIIFTITSIISLPVSLYATRITSVGKYTAMGKFKQHQTIQCGDNKSSNPFQRKTKILNQDYLLTWVLWYLTPNHPTLTCRLD